uniref:Odorant receptor n=2 Tax=Vespula pensylvanica TaxID=30213 RepID=A0A834NJ79_VESPE|nr:hypothetical protein H0235_013612 [Vespula pensylvanica]
MSLTVLPHRIVTNILQFQLYQLFISDINFQLTVTVLQKTFTMKSIFAHFKLDCELTSNEDELNLMNKYTEESKIFTLVVIVTYNLYAISLISPCILNILLYFCALDNVDLLLPFSININITKAGLLYYILLIYQIIAIYLLMMIAGICLSSYLVVVQHACSQFSVIMLKIRQPFMNQKYIKTVQFDGTPNEELNWIIDIIIRYRRVTECQIPFYALSIRTQKLLLFALTRSMKPSVLSIGGFFVSSHEVFVGFYQLLTTDIKLESTMRVLQQMFTATCILCTYSATSFKFVAMKKLCSHIKSDYDRINDQEEFNIMETYTKRSKVYMYFIVVIYFLYGCSLISSSILNLFLYLFGKMDNAHLTLPISINYDLNSWSYYSLLIYQMFELSTELKKTSEIIECSSYIVSTLFTTYVNFYIGQRLMNHSNAASNELCQVPYYVLSVKTQKLLLFTIMRSMKPCILSIGGIFVSSHEVFAWITQKAFSFSTIYYNLR